VTTFRPIGPSRRAIGPAERNVTHITSAVNAHTAVITARSRGCVYVVAATTTVVIVPAPTVPGMASGTTASVFHCASGTSPAETCSSRRCNPGILTSIR
jgi:hypothetical protein